MKTALAFLTMTALLCGTPTRAQDVYPNKPIKMIIPLAPGGATDIIARVVAKELSTKLNTPVVVENRTGAGGIIGSDAAAKAAPDGYTVFVGNVSTNALNQTIYAEKLRFSPDAAFQPVTRLAVIPHILVASAKFEPRSVAELVAYAKAHPGKINHASPGVGSYSMLDMLRFEKAAGLEMLHIPYNGGAGQFLAPLVSNTAQIAFVNASSVIEMIKAGKLRALAVTTEKRLAELPDVPTMAEAGFPGIGTNAWQGLFVQRATPKPIVDKLFATLSEILKSAELGDNFARMLIVPQGSKSPAEFDAYVKAETQRWHDIVEAMQVKVD